MVIIVVADVEGGEEVGEQAQDVDDGQLVGGIGLPGKITSKRDRDCAVQSQSCLWDPEEPGLQRQRARKGLPALRSLEPTFRSATSKMAALGLQPAGEATSGWR